MEELTELEELFNFTIEYGKFVRKFKLDGLKSWKKLKDILKDYEDCIENCEWKLNAEEMYNYIHNTLGMKGEDSDDQKSADWEKFHFFLQLARIPKNNTTINLTRICQIAYNIGQKSCETYSECAEKYFEKNKLGKLNSYVKNCNFLKSLPKFTINPAIVPSQQDGGNNDAFSLLFR
jgi:hypothetical protein